MDTPQEKICPKCKKSKPLADFGNDKNRPGGKSTKCLLCTAERARELHTQNLEGRHAQRKREAAKKKAAGYKRIRTPAYHARQAARHQERREENLEGLKAIWQRAGKTYREKHPEKIIAANKSPHIKAWHKAHPASAEDRAMYMERRRARKCSLPDTWTPAQQAFMLQYWNHSCAICGNPKGFFWTLAMDHWIPLASPQCPGTIATNMLPLCHGNDGCNNSKGYSEPHAWLLRRFGTKKTTKIERTIHVYFAQVKLVFTDDAL